MRIRKLLCLTDNRRFLLRKNHLDKKWNILFNSRSQEVTLIWVWRLAANEYMFFLHFFQIISVFNYDRKNHSIQIIILFISKLILNPNSENHFSNCYELNVIFFDRILPTCLHRVVMLRLELAMRNSNYISLHNLCPWNILKNGFTITLIFDTPDQVAWAN